MYLIIIMIIIIIIIIVSLFQEGNILSKTAYLQYGLHKINKSIFNIIMYLVFNSFLGFSAKVVKIITIWTKFALPKRSQVQFGLCRKITYNV